MHRAHSRPARLGQNVPASVAQPPDGDGRGCVSDFGGEAHGHASATGVGATTGAMVSRAYTRQLGFTLTHQQLPAFASVSLGDIDMLLSGPGASGSRQLPNGQRQEPGGCNRLLLRVVNLPACVRALASDGVTCRNDMVVGPGGRQVQIEDPDGTPIELFEPAPKS